MGKNCFGCGGTMEFTTDRFCQKCEGKHVGTKYAQIVRYEVLAMAKITGDSPNSERMQRYKTVSVARWRETAMNMIDVEKYSTFYQAFMRTLANLTATIETTSAPATPAARYED